MCNRFTSRHISGQETKRGLPVTHRSSWQPCAIFHIFLESPSDAGNNPQQLADPKHERSPDDYNRPVLYLKRDYIKKLTAYGDNHNLPDKYDQSYQQELATRLQMESTLVSGIGSGVEQIPELEHLSLIHI